MNFNAKPIALWIFSMFLLTGYIFFGGYVMNQYPEYNNDFEQYYSLTELPTITESAPVNPLTIGSWISNSVSFYYQAMTYQFESELTIISLFLYLLHMIVIITGIFTALDLLKIEIGASL